MGLEINERALKAMTDVYGSLSAAAAVPQDNLRVVADRSGVALQEIEEAQAALIAAACERAHLGGVATATDREAARGAPAAHGGGRLHQLGAMLDKDHPQGLSTGEKIETNRLMSRFLEEMPSEGQIARARLFVEEHFRPAKPTSAAVQKTVDAVESMIRSGGFYWGGMNTVHGEGPKHYGALLGRLSDGVASRQDMHAVLHAVNLLPETVRKIAKADAAGLEAFAEKYGSARVGLVRSMTELLDSQGILETLWEGAKDALQS